MYKKYLSKKLTMMVLLCPHTTRACVHCWPVRDQSLITGEGGGGAGGNEKLDAKILLTLLEDDTIILDPL